LVSLLDDPRSHEENILGANDAARVEYEVLLVRLFDWLGHPIRFQELVRIVRLLKRPQDLSLASDGERSIRTLSEWLPDTGRRPDQRAELRECLEQLWLQIERLPHLERMAYLLNFTAGDGQLEIFEIYCAATIRRIGATLSLTEEHFARVWPELRLGEEERHRVRACQNYDERFALLWRHLPLRDATIAKILGAERQKVINLRKAAATRLSRRLANGKAAS
jgi:hypothetical protein